MKKEIIDIHAHILPGIDDGSDSVKESVEMAKSAVECGVNVIVATPHKIKAGYDSSIAEIEAKVSLLRKELKKKKIDVRILFGAENYAEYGLDNKFTINKKNYLLLDLPMDAYPEFCYNIVDDLKKKRIIPIIAHPEQNHDIRHNPHIVERLISKGCLMQLNAGSLLQNRVKDFALYLLKNNAYHIIASNAHDKMGYRVFCNVVDILMKGFGEEKVFDMVNKIPSKIINGERFVPERVFLLE